MSTNKEDEMLIVQGDEDRDKEIFSAGFIPGWIGEGGLQPEPTNEFEEQVGVGSGPENYLYRRLKA